MTILNRYISTSFIVSLGVTLGVLTLVISIGLLFRFTDLLARGAAPRMLFSIFFNGLPYAASYAIPISCLIAALLIFSRMSGDMEIVATRACGISFRQLLRMPAMFSLLLTALCFYMLNEVSPLSRYKQQVAFRGLGGMSPLELLEEGRFNHDFPGMHVYFGRKQNQRLYDVIIMERMHDGRSREIRAKSGTVDYTGDRDALIVNLHDVRIDPIHPERDETGYARELPVVLSLDRLLRRPMTRRVDDFTFSELIDRMQRTAYYYGGDEARRPLPVQRMILRVELHKRMVLALACFAFVMLGAPLGMKNQRHESSINIALSLIVIFSFYVFVIIAESLADRPEFFPWILLWVPLLSAICTGYWLARRAG